MYINNNIITRLTIFLLFLVISISCVKSSYVHLNLNNLQINSRIEQFVLNNQHHFTSSYTLLVLLDRKSCAGNLVESIWWKVWQKYMLDHNLGFAFITSKADSNGVIIASNLDSTYAPVFVLPDSDTTISYLWSPGEISPLKLLIDSTGEIIYAHLSVIDSIDNHKLMHNINTIIHIK